MRKGIGVALGAGLLAASTLHSGSGAAVAAEKGGEQGIVIEGGKNKQLGVPDTKNKSGSEQGFIIEGGKTRQLGTPDTKNKKK